MGEAVAQLGGLHIIGSERHEARRIDNQLRGRSGRQGDQGSSRFYMCLEDDLLRIFGSERISSIMGRLGMKEGEPIQHPLISKAIEGAQKKVEAMHFEIRKHLLEYDNVANQQRQIIYSLRRNILEEKNLDELLNEMIGNVLSSLFNLYVANLHEADSASLKAEILRIFNLDIAIDGISSKNIEVYKDKIIVAINNYLNDKKAMFGEHYNDFLRFLMINILDSKWKDHLLSMDYLRDSVGLRGYGQKDPLIEYKKEAYNLFVELISRIHREVVEFLFHVEVKEHTDVRLEEKKRTYKEERRDIFEGDKEEKKKPVKRNMPKVGRNDLCPCGSGKKYKKCCGANVGVVAK